MARTRRAQQAADEVRYTNRGAAHDVVAKAVREQSAAAVTDLRDLETPGLMKIEHPSLLGTVERLAKAVSTAIAVHS